MFVLHGVPGPRPPSRDGVSVAWTKRSSQPPTPTSRQPRTSQKLGLLAAHPRGHPTRPPTNQPRAGDASPAPMWQPPPASRPARQPARARGIDAGRQLRPGRACVPILQPAPLTAHLLSTLPFPSHTDAHTHVSALRAPGTVTIPVSRVAISSIFSRGPPPEPASQTREGKRALESGRPFGCSAREAQAAGG